MLLSVANCRDLFLTTAVPLLLASPSSGSPSEQTLRSVFDSAKLSAVVANERMQNEAPFFATQTTWLKVPGEPIRKVGIAAYLGIMRALDLIDDSTSAGRNIGRTFTRVLLPLFLLLALVIRRIFFA